MLAGGFLTPVMKGWYVVSRPDERTGESTAWCASFWGFCASYLGERFGSDWCLSPEQSLLIHTGDWTVPRRLMVRGPRGGNKPIPLPRATSLLCLRTELPAASDVTEVEGLRLYTVPAAPVASGPAREPSPHVSRMRMAWEAMRGEVLAGFPPAPGLPAGPGAYLKTVDEVYARDACHSLSIEGYHVSPELVERVRGGDRDPGNKARDREARDALAARGYYDAFLAVRESVGAVLGGEGAGEVARQDHGTWCRLLFAPSVTAGIVAASDLAGYRNGPVRIRRSRHVPPPPHAVRGLMPLLFDLLEAEPEPGVRAVLGHFFFVYIHPYPDGNGRMGRFLMNLMLASGGYPWTGIPAEERDACVDALEQAGAGRTGRDHRRLGSCCLS